MTGPPRDRWLIAKTDRRYPYPCRCRGRCRTAVTDPDGHPAYWCPCWGRTDPPSPRCCANTEET